MEDIRYDPPEYQDNGRSIYHLRSMMEPTLEIRLLKLRRRALLVGQVQYTLEVFYLDSAPDYRAISYMWGESSPTCTLSVEKTELQIRQNCQYALEQVRQHWPGDYVWIDSICIDQENFEEKSAQVQMMGRIFTLAKSVSACVGPHGNDSEHLIKNLKSARSLDSSSQRARNHWLQRPYWYRLWIVQELCLSRDIYFHCGSSMLRWPDVYKAIVDSHYDIPYVRFLGDLVNQANVKHQPPILRLQEHTKILQSARCTDPRDKIFGLLNLAKLEDDESFGALRVDYAKSAWSLALEIALRPQRPGTAHPFPDQVAQLLILLEISATSTDFRSQVKLRMSTLDVQARPSKRHFQHVEEICADILRHDLRRQALDVRIEHPGWVSCIRACQAVRLQSTGNGCIHELYITTVQKRTVERPSKEVKVSRAPRLRRFVETLASQHMTKPDSKPHWYDIVPQPEQGYKVIYHNQQIVAVVGENAAKDDLLIFSDMAPTSAETQRTGKHLFIARKFDGDVYQIVDQGFFLPNWPRSDLLSCESLWILGAEDAMVATAHLQLHRCSQGCRAAGRCQHWLEILKTAVAGSPLSSFIFCHDDVRMQDQKPVKGCPLCGIRQYKAVRWSYIIVITVIVAAVLHPAIALTGLFLYIVQNIIVRETS